MPTPATRTPVRIARGTYSNLNSSIADLLEGEICYATDQNKLYVVEGGVLTEPPYLPSTGGALTGDITLNAQSDLRFADADSSNWVAFQSPATVASNVTWTLPSADGTSGQILSSNGSGTLSWVTRAALDIAQTYTAAQRGTISALGAVTAGTTTLDFATANNFSLSLPAGGTVTLATPINITAGQSGCIVVTQNGTTAATVAYSTAWKWQGGAPSVSTTLSSVNVIAYFVESATRITAQLLTNTVN